MISPGGEGAGQGRPADSCLGTAGGYGVKAALQAGGAKQMR